MLFSNVFYRRRRSQKIIRSRSCTTVVGRIISQGLLDRTSWQFSFLSPKEALNAGQVCRNWYRLSKDEMLWKSLLQETLFPDRTKKIKLKLPKSASSWLKEFQRIHYKTPFVESQILEEHTDEVLHVTFSHNGQLLASSSKDCSVILWRVSSCTCVSMAQKINFQERNWEYVQFCEFNASDTLLLVSGVNKLRRLSYTGKGCFYWNSKQYMLSFLYFFPMMACCIGNHFFPNPLFLAILERSCDECM